MSDWHEKQTQGLDHSEFKEIVYRQGGDKTTDYNKRGSIFLLPEEVKIFSKRLFLGQ